MLCEVLTASRSKAIGEGLTYESGELEVKAGQLVLVPLRGQQTEGIVLSTNAKPLEEKVSMKTITHMESADPLLTEAQIKTMQWMAEYYHCSVRQAAQVFLPPLPWSGLLPRPERWYTFVANKSVRGPIQQRVLEVMEHEKEMEENRLFAETGANRAAIKRMEELGIMRHEDRRPSRTSNGTYQLKGALPTLSEVQKNVYENIQKGSKPNLLFGITGSGKTAIYAHLIADCLKEGKQSILLVPEILLTQEVVTRFKELLGEDQLAILHSRLTASERRAQWQRIVRGEAALVIGSRSALFAPCPNLGLVIIDEEHEWTYKNEQTPRYHARETATALCTFAGATLLLGSATPSLESWQRARTDEYSLARLPERYGDQSLPKVRVIDLATVKFGSEYPFSPPLIDAIAERLQKKEQSVLFLNHRGMATGLMCLDCRKRIVSAATGLPLTVHNSTGGRPILVDHITGDITPVPSVCPSCGSVRLHAVGAGTQRLESILANRFPSARILRADSDTLKSPDQMKILLAKMHDEQADILLGTQSVVKGLDLPKVTLAAVMLADVGLSLPHFRAGERVLQLLTQLTGRSGRATAGEVIIQTFRPDAPEVRHAAAHSTEKYMEEELKTRKELSYPPFIPIVRLLLRGPGAPVRSKELTEALRLAAKNSNISVSVHTAPTLFGAGHVWHILIRGADAKKLLELVELNDVAVDIDPMDCL